MFIYKKPTAFGLPMLKLIKTNLPTHSVCFPMKNNVELLLIWEFVQHLDRFRAQNILALFEPQVITCVR